MRGLQALTTATIIGGKILTVCPASVTGNWLREVEPWRPESHGVTVRIPDVVVMRIYRFRPRHIVSTGTRNLLILSSNW